jgi:hypothetical protein
MVHPLLDSVSAAFLAAHIRWSLLRVPSVIGAPDGLIHGRSEKSVSVWG